MSQRRSLNAFSIRETGLSPFCARIWPATKGKKKPNANSLEDTAAP
ncbi:unnamed protein product [marine sediment metagenome]|uniref:Uncharacterized protein n=1 Tax=marine sediment metagenome TaxID=412755 RepID=X0T5B8_9ZZZZ